MPTVNLQVAAQADDAYELDDGTGFSSSGTSIDIIADASAGTRQNSGWRFDSVAIPYGAKITVADFQVYSYSNNDDPNCDIYFEDVDDADDFSTTADVTSRTRTSASVAWDQDAVGTGYVSAPDISAPAQEVVNRSGWASGNAVVVLADGSSDATKTFLTVGYAFNPSLTATLDITYTDRRPTRAASTYMRRRTA